MYTKTSLPHSPVIIDHTGTKYLLISKSIVHVPHMPLGVYLINTLDGYYWYVNVPYSPVHGPFVDESAAWLSISEANEETEILEACKIENQFYEDSY